MHTQDGSSLDPALQLHPGQQAFMPAQEAEAERFVAERLQAQLSTEPVDEQEAERLLRRAYRAIGRHVSPRISWVESPPHLQKLLPPGAGWRTVFMWKLEEAAEASIWKSLGRGAWPKHRFRPITEDPLWRNLGSLFQRRSGFRSVGMSSVDAVMSSLESTVIPCERAMIRTGTSAYDHAWRLTCYHFFATYLAPNEAHALAHFNELVSGYWLGQQMALVVRRPNVLSFDAAGRLHSASSKCIEYQDGWGCYAWHGVVVPERVILAPERLSRDDFLSERNAEVRRVVQERMGERFMREVGGKLIDEGPRGTLYEVALPNPLYPWEPRERVARYVQVQDTSTPRRYFLRVPPTIQTAAEAVAWSFGLSVEDYGPAQET